MSQTTQILSIPLVVGQTSARIASTATAVGGARAEDGEIVFTAGPDFMGSRYVERLILVQDTHKEIPKGYQNAGTVNLGNRQLKVLVELPG